MTLPNSRSCSAQAARLVLFGSELLVHSSSDEDHGPWTDTLSWSMTCPLAGPVPLVPGLSSGQNGDYCIAHGGRHWQALDGMSVEVGGTWAALERRLVTVTGTDHGLGPDRARPGGISELVPSHQALLEVDHESQTVEVPAGQDIVVVVLAAA